MHTEKRASHFDHCVWLRGNKRGYNLDQLSFWLIWSLRGAGSESVPVYGRFLSPAQSRAYLKYDGVGQLVIWQLSQLSHRQFRDNLPAVGCSKFHYSWSRQSSTPSEFPRTTRARNCFLTTRGSGPSRLDPDDRPRGPGTAERSMKRRTRTPFFWCLHKSA